MFTSKWPILKKGGTSVNKRSKKVGRLIWGGG